LDFRPRNFCASQAIAVKRGEFAAHRTFRAICHQRASSQTSNTTLTEVESINNHAAKVIAGFGGVKTGGGICGICGNGASS
jgi:O-glycosyl hydrolase